MVRVTLLHVWPLFGMGRTACRQQTMRGFRYKIFYNLPTPSPVNDHGRVRHYEWFLFVIDKKGPLC